LKFAKLKHKRETAQTCVWVSVDNTPESILRAFTQPHNENPYIKIIPYIDTANSLKATQQDFTAVIQAIVLEYDNDSIGHQLERAKAIAELLGCPIQLVYSGNKSIHIIIWAHHFADNAEQYWLMAMSLYWELSRALPHYFYFATNETRDSVPDAEKHNLPDISMFSKSRSTRQPMGRREVTGTLQAYTVLKSFKEGTLLKPLISPVIELLLKRKGSNASFPAHKTRHYRLTPSNNSSLLAYLEHDLNLEIRNNNISPCPVCGHNDCFTYYPHEDTWYCFSDQHASGGTIYNLIHELRNP